MDFYLKKSLFRDRSLYYRPFRGDTNLTEFYSDLYGLPGPNVDWQVPDSFVTRLRLSPNFFTAPELLTAFERATPPDPAGREIDVHARLGLGPDNGSWYRRMREHALLSLKHSAISRLLAGGAQLEAYMAEFRNAKLCFSPFGYGELCWRDIEAILAGAVLVKPDMGHLETLPDLYDPGVTYLPVRWDFADLKEVMQIGLVDVGLRQTMAREAQKRIKHYLENSNFVSGLKFLFDMSFSVRG